VAQANDMGKVHDAEILSDMAARNIGFWLELIGNEFRA
jgi:hypothetical protein